MKNLDQDKFWEILKQVVEASNNIENLSSFLSRNGRFITNSANQTNSININSSKDGWSTPLHYAAHKGNVEVTKLLIKYGADINAADKEGWTPLHLAAARGHAEIVELLRKENAKVNVQTVSNATPLELAKTEEIKELLQNPIKLHISVREYTDDIQTVRNATPLELVKTEEIKELLQNPIKLQELDNPLKRNLPSQVEYFSNKDMRIYSLLNLDTHKISKRLLYSSVDQILLISISVVVSLACCIHLSSVLLPSIPVINNISNFMTSIFLTFQKNIFEDKIEYSLYNII